MIVKMLIVLVLSVFFCNNLLAETYIREYTYKASEADSKLSSRTIALDQVKIILLQEIGTHIRQSIKITKDGSGNSFAREDVEAITAGLTKVDILEEKWNGVTYYLKAKIDADTQSVLNALEEYKKSHTEESRQQIEILKANERALQKSRDEVARLRKELEFAKNNNHNKSLADRYQMELNTLSAGDIVNKGFESSQQGKHKEAVRWYLKAAEKGSVSAQLNLGAAYIYGRGVKKNYQQSVFWYSKAAEQGSAEGQSFLGGLYIEGHNGNEDVDKGISWLNKAANQNYGMSQLILSMLYAEGKGVKQDSKKAAIWYRKAVENSNDAKSQYFIGYMHEKGKGLNPDKEQAMVWYKKSAEQGYAEAQRALGRIEYSRKNYRKSVAWDKKAAENGDVKAQFSLGLVYAKGHGVPQDWLMAKKWFTQACNGGMKLSCGPSFAEIKEEDIGEWNSFYQRRLNKSKIEEEAVLILNKLEIARKDINEKQAQPAEELFNNGLEYEKQEKYIDAAYWYLQAAEQGNANAQANLGSLYSRGKGVEKDKSEAVKWYRKSADQGNASGQHSLGFMYARGDGVKTDYDKAIALYFKAVAQGYPSSYGNLSAMYSQGHGVKQDDYKAAAWKRVGCDEGDNISCWGYSSLNIEELL